MSSCHFCISSSLPETNDGLPPYGCGIELAKVCCQTAVLKFLDSTNFTMIFVSGSEAAAGPLYPELEVEGEEPEPAFPQK